MALGGRVAVHGCIGFSSSAAAALPHATERLSTSPLSTLSLRQSYPYVTRPILPISPSQSTENLAPYKMPAGYLALHAVVLVVVSIHHANLVHALGKSAELCSAAVPNATAGKLCAPAVTVLGMPKAATSGNLCCSACAGAKGLARRSVTRFVHVLRATAQQRWCTSSGNIRSYGFCKIIRKHALPSGENSRTSFVSSRLTLTLC